MLSQAFLPGIAADCSILCQSRHTAITCQKMQTQYSLTLRWRSFLGHSSDVVTPFLPRKEAIILIRDICCRTALGFSKMQGQNSLTLRWRSLLRWGDVCIVCLFGYNADLHIQCGGTRQYSPLVVECVRLKVVDADIKHIETAFVHSMIVCNDSHIHYWQPILRF